MGPGPSRYAGRGQVAGPSRMRFTFGVLCVAAGASANALPFDYDLERGPGLRVCDDQYYRGQTADAWYCYEKLVKSSEDPLLQAEAVWGLGDPKRANKYFRKAVEVRPEEPRARVRWGHLYVATHQEGEAMKLFQEGLAIDPEYLPAKLGMASVLATRFEGKARTLVEEVLEADPRRFEAHLLLAGMALEENDLDGAEEHLTEALDIATVQRLPPLEVYALYAALDLLRGITQSVWTARALSYNPTYGDIYAIPAHFYVITRRYREAIWLLQRGLEVEWDNWAARASLGVHLLRENRIEEAQQHLVVAYTGDPYSPQVVNTLRLIDSFDKFRLYPSEASPDVILRLHEDEGEELKPYLMELSQRSIQVLPERYRFELLQPVVVELYSDHDDFAVRTLGLPGIGLLGVTFGYLVAMDSPSARREGDFNWGTTLWHEMAHVITLEATNHLVPRWFSEGISVYEEWQTGPRPGEVIPLTVIQAIAEDKLLPVADLDAGFVRPTYPGQIAVSYTQAGLICLYISERWGHERLVGFLDAFARRMTTPEAVPAILEVSPAEFDEAFSGWLQARLESILAGLEDYGHHLQAGWEALGQDDWAAAIDGARAAIDIFPDYVEADSPHLLLANAFEAREERAEAVQALERFRELGGREPASLKRLAGWLDEAGRREAAIEVLTDVIYVAPLDASLHAQLGDWLLSEHRGEEAVRAFATVLALDPHDKAVAHYRMARAWQGLKNPVKTRQHLLLALEAAPHYREAQQMLLEITRVQTDKN